MALTVSKRVRLLLAWCLGLYLADMFVRMGWIKFDPKGFWTAAFVRWGFPPWLRVGVGVVEVVGGVMLVIPWLAPLGGTFGSGDAARSDYSCATMRGRRPTSGCS